MSCRRTKDGGFWTGSEAERLTLLRQCVIDKADYVEIELDVADQIRPFPGCKRVISYTNMQETPADIADIYAQCRQKSPDVVKLTTLARTPEEAWPLVQILAKTSEPTVVCGLGKPGVMLSILGKKIGAPWTYAALEKGMETYPGQHSVRELEEVYHYRAIERGTRLIGVTGFGAAEYATLSGLNAGLAELKLPARCLPLGVGDMGVFRKVIDAVRLAALVVDDAHRSAIMEVATDAEPLAKEAEAADVLLHKQDRWHAYNTLCRAGISALEAAIHKKHASDKPLQGRMVMIVGTNGTAATMAFAVKQRGGVPILAGRDRDAAHAIAQKQECRFVPFEALYSTVHDTLIVCSEEKIHAKGKQHEEGIHPGYLKPTFTVMDLTSLGTPSRFIQEAVERGCSLVKPRQILVDMVLLQLKLILGEKTGKDVPREVVERGVENAIGPE
jgi:3-dehydroquinate dehydratase/shikimate dehydrogenase